MFGINLFGRRGPDWLVVRPPLGLAGRPFVDVVEEAHLAVVSLTLDGRVGKLVADDIMVTRIEACIMFT